MSLAAKTRRRSEIHSYLGKESSELLDASHHPCGGEPIRPHKPQLFCHGTCQGSCHSETYERSFHQNPDPSDSLASCRSMLRSFALLVSALRVLISLRRNFSDSPADLAKIESNIADLSNSYRRTGRNVPPSMEKFCPPAKVWSLS